MKKFITTSLIFLFWISLFAQPDDFTWNDRFGKDYISVPKDQRCSGPCNVFAAIAGIEAAVQIYFNKTAPLIDLAERYCYSMYCSGNTPGETNIDSTLYFAMANGIVKESCMPYPSVPGQGQGYYYGDYEDLLCSDPIVTIPGYQEIALNTNQELQRAIIDHGPIPVLLKNVSSTLYGGENGHHAVLLLGWQTGASEIEWHIKDSWPGAPATWYTGFGSNTDIFDFSPHFCYIIHKSEGDEIDCSGDNCSSIFNSRYYTDNDEDGFYYWGIGSKPDSCPGACAMDFNDKPGEGNNIICLDENYNPQPAPTISGPEYVCQSGDSFVLNVPSGFDVSWSLSPPLYYFYTPTSGTTATAFVHPKPQYIGKQCTITYTISDDCTELQYSKSFVINGPREDQVSITVEDAYGGSPPSQYGIFLLCPYTTYYIYYNNNSNCSTSGYQWVLPSGWTKYYQYDNYVSINTNSSPWGTVEVYANTCCGYKKIKTQHFSSGYNCGGYYSVYPNPASTEFTIKFSDKFDFETEDALLEIYDSFLNIKYIQKGFMKENTIFTNDWKDGLYYIRLKYKGKYYYNKLRISH